MTRPGYHEGKDTHPELDRGYRGDAALLLHWYDAVRSGDAGTLPAVTYYLMGAGEWCTASCWPPAEARARDLYLGPAGTLAWDTAPEWSEPDRFTYDPEDPTPTLGGSVLSHVYPPAVAAGAGDQRGRAGQRAAPADRLQAAAERLEEAAVVGWQARRQGLEHRLGSRHLFGEAAEQVEPGHQVAGRQPGAAVSSWSAAGLGADRVHHARELMTEARRRREFVVVAVHEVSGRRRRPKRARAPRQRPAR